MAVKNSSLLFFSHNKTSLWSSAYLQNIKRDARQQIYLLTGENIHFRMTSWPKSRRFYGSGVFRKGHKIRSKIYCFGWWMEISGELCKTKTLSRSIIITTNYAHQRFGLYDATPSPTLSRIFQFIDFMLLHIPLSGVHGWASLRKAEEMSSRVDHRIMKALRLFGIPPALWSAPWCWSDWECRQCQQKQQKRARNSGAMMNGPA